MSYAPCFVSTSCLTVCFFWGGGGRNYPVLFWQEEDCLGEGLQLRNVSCLGPETSCPELEKPRGQRSCECAVKFVPKSGDMLARATLQRGT